EPLVDTSVLNPIEGTQSMKSVALRAVVFTSSLISSSFWSCSVNASPVTAAVLLNSAFPNRLTTTFLDNFLVLFAGAINSPVMVARGIVTLMGSPNEPVILALKFTDTLYSELVAENRSSSVEEALGGSAKLFTSNSACGI